MPKIPVWIFILIAALYFSAARVDTMDVDASQYAEMSREMMHSNNWLWLYDRGADYLDKPPFLFWVSALSMKVFGANNFGYKFPSVLFALFAIYATYRLARLIYEENTARLAALILATCQGMFLMTNDVRTDTILMSWVIGAIWFIKEWEVGRNSTLNIQHSIFFLGACVCIALGMMTKGPIALMVPVFCFAGDWALKRNWKMFFQPIYLIGLLLIALLLLPMSIGLYQQFDLHPGKIINGHPIQSGLRFFYWSQSFGRLTGESPWDNGAPFEFLLMNMFWAFLPWIILFLVALIKNILLLFQKRFRLQEQEEWITTGGFILAYLSLASSKYQLPHYIFVVFPLCAIITAKFLGELLKHKQSVLFRGLQAAQYFVSAVLMIASALTFTYVFKAGAWAYVVWFLCLFIAIVVMISKKTKPQILWLSVVAILTANIFLTHHFYPELLKFQLGSQIGRFIKQQKIPAEKFYAYQTGDAFVSGNFYAQQAALGKKDEADFASGDYILTSAAGLDSIRQKALKYELLKQGEYFKVSELTPAFLNPATRSKAVMKFFLIRLHKN